MLVVLFVVLLSRGLEAGRCDRHPEGANSGRQNENIPFRLRVESLPPMDQPEALPRPANFYQPGQEYLVSLAGEQEAAVRHFMDFMLTVESLEDQQTGGFSPSASTFTKFSERCRNAVVQTSSMPKLEVSTYWRAPPPGSGCVVFRASVVEMRNVWYMDDGPLSLQLCEEQTVEVVGPSIMDPCCACDEAKYEMAFEGLWSRHTHPKDFPKDHFKAKFSDVIGASHMVDYRFWNYGDYASEGLKELAEEGSTRTLESELKEKSQHIRTIIKARGIGYPNVTGKTFAVFRVDNKNHLMSVVSKIAPSPDWIVGVSGLELCLPNCSWIERQKIELYPWDIGTDNGITYESDDSPSIPAETIIKITSSSPNDPLSPFYEPRGRDMKPLANLYVTRQRLYEKESCRNTVELYREDSCAVTQWSPWSPCSASCGEGQRRRRRTFLDQTRARASRCRVSLSSRTSCTAAPCRDRQPADGGNARCELSEWTDWSRCSTTCGRGHRVRNRQYLLPHANSRCAYQPGAPRLEEVRTCNDEQGPCNDGGDDGEGDREDYGEEDGEGDREENGEEGAEGDREENEEEDEEGGREENEGGGREENGEEDEEGGREENGEEDGEGYREENGEEDGEGGREENGEEDGEGDEDEYEDNAEVYRQGNGDETEEGNEEDNGGRYYAGDRYGAEEYPEGNEEDGLEGGELECQRMTEWTAWSSCSVTCGWGTRIRNRYPDTIDDNTEMIARLMREEDEGLEEDEDITMGDEDCDTRTVEEEECEAPVLSCEMATDEEREICLMDEDKGPCYNTEIRWYFDKETLSCRQFEYGGCRGNRNKFNTREACEQMCTGVTVGETTTEGGPFNGLVPGNQISNLNNVGLMVPTYPYTRATRGQTSITSLTGRVLDCRVSAWSRWSTCSATCGPGYKQRTRNIKVSPINGGRPCPRKLLKRKKCHGPPCDDDLTNRPLRRRHSDEVNYEDVYGNSLEKKARSQEDFLNEIQPLRSSNEIRMAPEERAAEIQDQTFHKPPFIRVLQSGEIDCELSQWTTWSSCSMTCGTNAYKQRTRSILTQPSGGGLPCDKRIEVQPCMLQPCRPSQ